MDFQKHIIDDIITIRVIPNSSQQKLVEENNRLKLYLTSMPDKNKANLELVKFFKKKYNLNVQIKSGSKNREKILKVI